MKKAIITLFSTALLFIVGQVVLAHGDEHAGDGMSEMMQMMDQTDMQNMMNDANMNNMMDAMNSPEGKAMVEACHNFMESYDKNTN